MISDVLLDALDEIERYLEQSGSNRQLSPYLARCRAAMWDCVAHYAVPPGFQPFPRVRNWRKFNAKRMACGENPLTLPEYLALVGEEVADRDDDK
jgi:hypothetical protein